ncbi:hypothetical protein AQ914_04570 [Burkholderia pseudomallei]|uniref:type III secretion apparatus protein OrgA/MxiK n=1 Tax=Burkholderia pseudomallei TaxID=28450 RepID=UPI000975FAC4|nr:type III secretion apparatus protein OrgA/MxiK [Burkholderia pseudomallei]ONC26359.1 hypothetical protein AQ914_04570 [Burkholderia pseudomallei]
MIPVAQLLNIMYAPRLYVHPGHLPPACTPGADLPADIVNQKLIETHGLETRIEFSMPADPLVARCVQHWMRLPRICLLIGAHSLRSVLIQASRFAKLDAICRQFLCLPLPVFPVEDASGAPNSVTAPLRARCENNEIASIDPIDEEVIVEAGLVQMGSLLQRLPPALRQRLALLFSPALQPCVLRFASEEQASPQTPDGLNVSVFSYAVNYALLKPTSIS